MNKQKLILLVSIAIGCIVFAGFLLFKTIKSKKEKGLFEKSLSCQSLINNIKNDIAKIPNEKNIVRDVSLKKIFYSKKENSCLYIVEYYGHNVAEGPYTVNLVNALTHETVESIFILGVTPGSNLNTAYYNIDGSKNMGGWNKLEEFYKHIKEKYE
jgi:hypothetical protein